MEVDIRIDLSPDQLRLVREFLHSYIPDTLVWAFGSRVKFTAKPSSDLDLVAFICEEQKSRFSELKEAFDESNVPFRVDLHSWNDLPESFRRNIEKEHVVLHGVKNKGAD